MAEFSEMMQNDYGIKKKPITTRNPQANAILEHIHQVIGNMIRTFELQERELEEVAPWKVILAAIMFALGATFHTTLQATLMQLVFVRDAMINIGFQADWNYIKNRKQHIIKKNNVNENKKRTKHIYEIGDKVLYKVDSLSKYGVVPYKGPYPIVQVNINGTVRIHMENVTDTVNIRLLHPYKE